MLRSFCTRVAGMDGGMEQRPANRHSMFPTTDFHLVARLGQLSLHGSMLCLVYPALHLLLAPVHCEHREHAISSLVAVHRV